MSGVDALAITLVVVMLWPVLVAAVIEALRIVTEQF